MHTRLFIFSRHTTHFCNKRGEDRAGSVVEILLSAFLFFFFFFFFFFFRCHVEQKIEQRFSVLLSMFPLQGVLLPTLA